MATINPTVKQVLDKLAPQRRKFVLAYCETFNATQAALMAGYSKKTARTYGSQLLTFLDIKLGIKAVLETAGMNPEEIAARWDRIARGDLADFYTKVEYEERPKVQQSLYTAIAEVEEKIVYEFEYMVRSWEIFGTKPDDQAKELEQHDNWARHRKLDILRFQMQLERDPAATRLVDGPPVKRYRMELDLVKAADLGVLDLLRSTSEGRNGTGITIRDPDAALENLAKWRGMLTTQIDLTSGGEPIAQPPLLGVLSLEQKKQFLEAKRKAEALTQEGATNG
jgi:phage terminase small subunit